jgi:hypothetical protein
MIDVTHNTVDWIAVEYVDGIQGRFDAAAYNEESDLFFFANYNSGELWVNPLGSDEGSFFSGFLTGTPASGCYYDQSYYYVDEQLNSINKVDFSSDWTISQITVLSTIPGNIVVSDLTITSSGTMFYIVGGLEGGGTELIVWDSATDTYNSMSIPLNENTQITFGSDGNLYALGGFEQGSGVEAYIIDTSTATLTPLYSGVIIVEEPISDVSRGPSPL